MGVLQVGGGVEVVILAKLGRKGITKNTTFEQSPESNEEMSHEDIWGRNIPVKCKGPKVSVLGIFKDQWGHHSGWNALNKGEEW